jgi:hypothetical protein
VFRHRDDRHGGILRDRVLGQVAPLLSSSFDDLINPADEVLDAHTTKNNWQMYGSRKPERDPYLVSHHLTRLWVR